MRTAFITGGKEHSTGLIKFGHSNPDGSHTINYYDNAKNDYGNDHFYTKGLLYKTEFYDVNNVLYNETENDYAYKTFDANGNFASDPQLL